MGKPRRSGGRRRCRHHDVEGIRARVVIEVGQREAAGGPATGTAQLRTVLVCDLADSTALVEKLGDRRAAELMRRHDRIARDLLNEHGGSEIDKTDGFLVLFERPLHAVGFALAYQRALRELEGAAGRPLRARVGIHVGEVQVWDNAAEDIALGAKRVEVEGLAKPVAARLMSVALPGQVLLSGIAFTLAQRAQDELGEVAPRVRWLTHGRYQFKGVPQPMLVHEAGEAGIAPLAPPPSGSKVRREVPWYRTPVALSVEMLVALGIVVAGLFAVLRPDPAIAFAERDWVVVGDLRNLTAEPLFDDALDTAFRIGLEQSRYVNLVPALQVRDALRRMERDSSVEIDRDTAVEVAMREGARAVLLPTITEVAGRIRVSVEVVDPSSGVTVYGESADGRGAEAALPAMDEVLDALRGRLGESLASIESTSAPLQKVTTANLEALRAFSLGIRAAETGRASEAYALFQRALELDPEFAAAHAKMAGYYYQGGNRALAWKHIRAAAASRDRLTARDQLYVDAYLAFFDTPQAMHERWLQLAQLYPDFVTGQQNVGGALWMHMNDAAGAAPWFEQVATSRHPFRSIGMQSLAVVLLAQGEREQAAHWAAQAQKAGSPPMFYPDLDLALSARDYPAVEAILAQPLDARYAVAAQSRSLREAAALLDRGRVGEGAAVLQGHVEALVGGALPEALVRARLGLAALRAWQPAADHGLHAVVDAELERLAVLETTRDATPVDHLLVAAILAAWHGDAELAARAVAAARPHAAGSGFHSRESALAIAEAELALHSGRPGDALARLERTLAENPPVLAHHAAMRAALALGDAAAAMRHARWLVDQRGRGLAEYMYFYALLVANVMAANEAQIELADLLLQQGDVDAARTALSPLASAWTGADADSEPQRRLTALRQRLSLDQEDE